MDPPADLQASTPAPASGVQSQAVAQDPGQKDYMTRDKMVCLNIFYLAFSRSLANLVCVCSSGLSEFLSWVVTCK